jgi:uncharacterized protein (TIGR03435 family)
MSSDNGCLEMIRCSILLNCVALAVRAVQAQPLPKQRSFEVASVKRAATGAQARGIDFPGGAVEEKMRMRGGPGTSDPGRIDYSGVTLKMLLTRAYDVKPTRISGPDWLAVDRYDISATLPRGTTGEEFRLMLQELLAERFQVQLHRESRVLPVYSLTVAKSGPKLKPAEKLPAYRDDDERKAVQQKAASEGMTAWAARLRSGELRANRTFGLASATVEKFAEVLATHLDRPVVDRTGLEGLHAFALSWWQGIARPEEDGDAASNRGPDIFTAIEEQLGLKLQAAREQVELLVIDSANRIPTSN